MPSGKRFAMFPERFLRRIARVATLLSFFALLLLGDSVSKADASGHVAGARLPSASAIGAGYSLVLGRQAQLFPFMPALLLFATAIGLLLYWRRMRALSLQRISRAENRVQEILGLYSCLQSEYDAMLDTVSDFVMFLTPEQKITWVNRNAESALGTEYETIIGRSCHEIWHTLIGDGFLCPGRKCSMSGVPERSIGWTRDKKQFDIRAIPVRDSCGNIVRIIEIGRDITAHSRLEQQLRQLHKVDSIGWLATGMVHDFNNILTSIIGFSYLLQKKDNAGEQSRIYLANITTSAERAEILTRTFLAFTRNQSISIVAEDLNDIVRGVEGLLASVLGEDVDLRMCLSASEIPVLADRLLLGQVLLTIAVYCRSAMFAGSDFIVKTSTWLLPCENNDGIDDISADFACLQVEVPTGLVPSQGWEILQEVFPAAESFEEGQDLGLAVVRGIVKQHGGSITLATGTDSGAVFTVFLPLQRKAGLEFRRENASRALSGGNETILVVEDDKWARSFLRELFEGVGYGIVEAGDAMDAMEKFRHHGDAISLVLCDMVLPKMSGRELCKELARIRPDLKVLFMSGYPGDVIRSRGIDLDNITLLAKPFKPEDILQAVRSALHVTV